MFISLGFLTLQKISAMRKTIFLLILAFAGFVAQAQAPAGYYNSANGKTGTELRQALHDIIDNHTTISYNQLWTAFWTTDNKGNNVVWDMYSDGASYSYSYYSKTGDQCGNYDSEGDCYNREHSWPKSWFDGKESSIPGRDLHHIFPTDGYVNAQRSNHPFGEVNNPTWTSQNGSKLGPCSTSGYSGTVFEPIDEYKGDFARAYFYMSTRYYGEDSSWGSSGMTNKSEILPWAMTLLLSWSDNDPVSQKEIDRNEVVYGIQGNRNPFIDHPEYAHLIWEPGWSGTSYDITCAAVYHGTINAPESAVAGTLVSLSATPAQGYMLSNWTVYKTGDQSTTVEVSGNGTFTMPTFNVTVSASFTQNNTSYTVTCATVSNGSISASPSNATSGTTVTLSNTPTSGYLLYSYYVYKTDDTNTLVYSGSDNSFTMPAYDVTVSASFVQPSSYSYIKVTSQPSDWSGDYLLVYENSTTSAYVWTGVNATNCYTEKTIANNTIDDGDLVSITVASMSGGYSIRVNGGTNTGKYISGTSGSNTINFQNTATANTLGYESNGITITSNTSVMRFNKESNAMLFRYYKSSSYTSQQPVQLYKKTSNASEPTHTIQFNSNYGSNSSYIQTVNEFVSTALQANTFTRPNYVFDCWNTAPDGSGTSYFNGATVTLLSDLTLYAQWVPSYTVTCATVNNGSISASPTEAAEGTFITLTATPETGYELDAWTVTDASDQPVNVENNQFEMPASNVTVSASFVAKESFTAHYYLVTSTDQLKVGRTYLIVNTAAEKALSTTQNSNNRAAVDVTIGSNNVIESIGNTVCELALGGSTGAWTFYDVTNSGYLYAASSSNNYLRTQTTNDANGQWAITIVNGVTTITAQGTNTRNTLRYNTSGLFSCYSSDASITTMPTVSLYIRSEENEYTANTTLACLNSFDKSVIRSGVTLTANSVLGIDQATDPSLVILEEGAQLIHQTAGLKATLRKTIQAYSNGESDGWYTIAVPFTEFTPSQVATGNYDLYAYDEDATAEWINFKSESPFPTTMSNGYLYAHSPSTTLQMTGALNSGNYTETVDLSYGNTHADIKGFNLLGNPTAHDITFSKTSSVSDGYYYLNNSENWVYQTGNSVPMGRGFLVKANAADQSVTLNPQSRDGSNTGRFINIDIDSEKVYVKLDEGVSMPLLNFRDNRSSLWLEHEERLYVMLVRDGANSIELNYKANKPGQHLLSVDAQGLNLDYLHLIDRLTGADIDLLQAPQYSFESASGNYSSRFQLMFSDNDNDNDNENEDFAYISNGNLIVNGEGTLQMVDILGRIVFTSEVNSSLLTPHSSLIPGVYVLRLITTDRIRTQKIVIR